MTKYASPAGAVSRRLIESIHGPYIEELHETMGWTRDSIVEMMLLCDGSVEKMKAAHSRWIKALDVKPDELGRGHDALRSFLAMLHHERDLAQQRAKELSVRLLRVAHSDFIAKTTATLKWTDEQVVKCLLVVGSPEEFELAFCQWYGRQDRQTSRPVKVFADDFLRFVRARVVRALDEDDE